MKLYREIAWESKNIVVIPGSSSELIVNEIKKEINEIIWNLEVALRKAIVRALFPSLI